MAQNDINVTIARIQLEIQKRLGLAQDHVVFDYSQENGQTQLDLITINPRHDQSFLFHSVTGKDKVDALEKMLQYVTKTIRQERSYTVQWSKVGDNDLHTSYFRARDINEVLEKFGHGRDMNNYTIFSITLNPIA